jgi:hypothetical protein
MRNQKRDVPQRVQAFTPASACQPDGRKTCTKPCVEQNSTRGSLPDHVHRVKLHEASYTQLRRKESNA